MYIQPNAKYENIIPVFSAVSVCSDMHELHGGLEIAKKEPTTIVSI